MYTVYAAALHRTQDPEPPTILAADTLSVSIIMLVCLSRAVMTLFHVAHCNAQLLPVMSVEKTFMKMNMRTIRRRMSMLWKNQFMISIIV